MPFTFVSPKIDDFFRIAREMHISLSYDDMRLLPRFSEIHPREITLETSLTRNLRLHVPIVSAAMDTVTEGAAAIVMAKMGGIGIVHKNFHPDPEVDIAMQVKEVHKVKHHLHGLIRNPIGFPDQMKLGELLEIKKRKGYNFHTFVVFDKNKKLAGLITRSVIKYHRHAPEKTLAEVMVKKVVTREEATAESAYLLMREHEIGTLVLVGKDKTVKGMYTFRDVESIVHEKSKRYTTDSDGCLCVGAAVGVLDDERLDALAEAGVDVIAIDSAHGASRAVIDALSRYKKKYPAIEMIAGNISTEEGAEVLVNAGADALKVGQGPGQICSTRIISGIGVMQADAIHRVARKASVPVIADGGIRYSGDIPIALACGASTVMLGQLLAGCKESPGECMTEKGKFFKIYRGMASLEAMAFKGGSDRYQKKASELKKLVPEGITKRLPYKGPLEDQVFMLLEGCKAGLGYCGAKNIAAFRKNAELVRIMPAGVSESHPDTSGMLGNPPNYSGE